MQAIEGFNKLTVPEVIEVLCGVVKKMEAEIAETRWVLQKLIQYRNEEIARKTIGMSKRQRRKYIERKYPGL